jgi:hypothetical protein
MGRGHDAIMTTTMRRRKPALRWGLTVVLVASLAACGSDGAGSSTSTTEAATTTTSTTTTTTEVPDPPTTTEAATTTTTAADEALAQASAAFDQWVSAVAAGDVAGAWEAMAESSRWAFGDFTRFENMSTELAEGWGAWTVAEDVSYSLELDEAGRTLLIVQGVTRPEGQVEEREVGVPIVAEGGALRVSPFEEFGNVALGLGEEASDTEQPPVPANSGAGRRIIYSNSEQRVWLVEDDGSVTDTYLVSGRRGVPAPGAYQVFSKSELAYAGHDGVTMSHMVRFAHGQNLAIGFHAIPTTGSGRPLQSEDELGEYRSLGCVRQSPGHAAELYDWAGIGTQVVVLA